MNKKVDEEFRHIHNEYLLQCTCTEMKDKINNLQSKIDKAIEYIEKNTHNIYADGYRDRETGEILSKEKTPIINRVFSQNPKDLLDILKEAENVENN